MNWIGPLDQDKTAQRARSITGNDIHCEHYCSSKVCCAPGYTTIRETTEPPPLLPHAIDRRSSVMAEDWLASDVELPVNGQ